MNPKKIAIFLSSSSYERLHFAVNFSVSLAVMECEVYMILLYWALKGYIRGKWDDITVHSLGGAEEEFLDHAERANLPSLYDMLEHGRDTGNIKLIACSASVQLMELTQEEVRPRVDEILGFPSVFPMIGDAGTKLFL